MGRKRIKVEKETLTAIRLNIPTELWRKFRAGCLYIDKDVNSELNRLLENWVKEWHKRISKPETIQNEQNDIERHNVEKSPFSSHSGHSGSSGEDMSST